MSRLLAGVDVHPTSLPPSAVLLVRRLADPAPGTLSARDSAMQAPAAWTRALRRAVDRAAREAARPAAGPVPPSAPAVVFLDPAELLACLARDFLLGDVAANWWWQAWLRATGRSTLEIVIDAWVRDARAIPAALAALERKDLVTRFARALSASQAATLLLAIAEAYDLPAIVRPPSSGDSVPPPFDAPTAARRADTGRRGERRLSAIPDDTFSDPPWASLNPPVYVPDSLDIEQRTLIGVGLSLWRAPLDVRTHAFQQKLHRWRHYAKTEPPRLHDSRVEPDRPHVSDIAVPGVEESVPTAPVDVHAAEPVPEAPPLEAVASEVPHVPMAPPVDAGGRQPSMDVEVATSVEPAASPAAAQVDLIECAADGADAMDLRPTFVETRSRQARDQSATPDAVIAYASEPAPQADAVSWPFVDAPSGPRSQIDAVTTGLGGVLFLVNVLERLRFFDRLDDHFHIESTIGAWGWLEIIARSLVGAGGTEADSDPLWRALGGLDGRPHGAAIVPIVRGPRTLRLPETWPAPARLPRPRRKAPEPGVPDDLRRFLDVLVPYVRWRLLQALHFHSRSRRTEDALLASRVLTRHGRLEWTATHVDLHMDLSQIDIAVRLAGLDANPGWVPALGRVVTFHFD